MALDVIDGIFQMYGVNRTPVTVMRKQWDNLVAQIAALEAEVEDLHWRVSEQSEFKEFRRQKGEDHR